MMRNFLQQGLTLSGVALGLAFSTGCAPTEPETAPWPASPLYDFAAEYGALATVTDEQAAIDALDGQAFAHYDVTAYISTIPFSGKMRTFTTVYGFTRYDKDPSDPTVLIETDSFCYSTFKANQPFFSVFSDDATSAIAARSTPVTVTVDTGGVAHISRPETPTYIGMINDPSVELITDQSAGYLECDSATAQDVTNAPCMFDHDLDGFPGVSVGITGSASGTLYMARRERYAYELDLYAGGVVAGHIDDSSEQLIWGADNVFLAGPSDPPQHKDFGINPVIFLPLGSTGVSYGDCAGLKTYDQDNPTFFPPEPELAIWE